MIPSFSTFPKKFAENIEYLYRAFCQALLKVTSNITLFKLPWLEANMNSGNKQSLTPGETAQTSAEKPLIF